MNDYRGAPCIDAPDEWTSDDPVRLAIAARICRAACPFRSECLTEALSFGPSHGVWGGYTATQLATFRKRKVLPV